MFSFRFPTYIFLALTSWVLLCAFSDWLLLFECCFVALFDGVCGFCSRLKCCSCCEVWWTFLIQLLCWCYKTLLRFLSGFLNKFCFEMVSRTIVWVSISDCISLSFDHSSCCKKLILFSTISVFLSSFCFKLLSVVLKFSEICSIFCAKADILHIT